MPVISLGEWGGEVRIRTPQAESTYPTTGVHKNYQILHIRTSAVVVECAACRGDVPLGTRQCPKCRGPIIISPRPGGLYQAQVLAEVAPLG